ncbi:hypothetical protein Q7P36_007168 [Cladosporium allicinum]
MHEPYRTQKGWQGRMHALPPERSDNNRHHAEYARKTRNGWCGKVCAPNPSGIPNTYALQQQRPAAWHAWITPCDIPTGLQSKCALRLEAVDEESPRGQALMAKQDVDQSISSRHARHPCPPLAYTLFQAVAAFLARDYARSRHPKREAAHQDLGQARAVAALLHD